MQTLSTGTTTQSPYYLTSPSAGVPHQCAESSSHGAGLEGSPGLALQPSSVMQTVIPSPPTPPTSPARLQGLESALRPLQAPGPPPQREPELRTCPRFQNRCWSFPPGTGWRWGEVRGWEGVGDGGRGGGHTHILLGLQASPQISYHLVRPPVCRQLIGPISKTGRP